MDFLSDSEVRKKCGIHEDNFLFASALNSLIPSTGQDNFTKFLQLCDVDSSSLSSVKARKFISNEFAALDFPSEIRKHTFEFLGHGENINRIRYCAPNIANVLKNIAPALQRINNKYEGSEKENFDWSHSNQDKQTIPGTSELQRLDDSSAHVLPGTSSEL